MWGMYGRSRKDTERKTVRFACGHEYNVTTYGKTSEDRQAYADRLSVDVCKECKRQKAYEEAAARAAELGFPALSGGEKKVRWAEQIRLYMYDSIIAFANDAWSKVAPEKKEEQLASYQEVLDDVERYFRRRRPAEFWIDIKDMHVANFAKMLYKESKESPQVEDDPAAIEEMTIRKEDCTSNNLCEIKIAGDTLTLTSDKDNAIIEVAHAMQMAWNKEKQMWELQVASEMCGNMEDRAVELGNRLLNAGFPIMMPSAKLGERATAGDYEPRKARWICKQGDEIRILWGGKYGDEIYKAARALPYAKYAKGGVNVRPRYYTEIEEFARLLDFSITTAAAKLLSAERAIVEKSDRVNPAAVKERIEQRGSLKDVLREAPQLDDLRDD